MFPALLALFEVNQDKGKKPPRSKPAKEAAPLSPKQEQAQERRARARKEERRSDLYAVLESLVASLGRKE